LGTVTALIGHSFGGAASLHVAAEQDDLGAVVALAAPSDTQHLAVLLAKMNPEIESTGVGDVTIGGYTWTIRREMLADFRQHDLPGRIAKISCPTLLLHSPVDQTVGFDHAIRIMGLLQNSPTQAAPVSIISLDGADHLLANSAADVDFVIATSAAFIKRYSHRLN
jgi:uncharacterized protein